MSNDERLFDLKTSVMIPVIHSAITGISVAISTMAISVLIHMDQPIPIGFLVGGIALGGSWLINVSWWRARVEELHAPTKTVTNNQIVKLEVLNSDGSYLHGSFHDIHISNESYDYAMRHLSNGGSLSVSAMCGGGRMTRSEFSELRDVLIERGLASWRHPHHRQLGCTLNLVGKHAIQRSIPPLGSNEPRKLLN